MKTISVELTFTESLLGTKPLKAEIFQEFVAKKKIGAVPKDELDANVRLEAEIEDRETQGTGFDRDASGNPILFDYQLRGQFKDACKALSKCPGMHSVAYKSNYKSLIDGTVFIQERQIPIELPEGATIGICERPLRAQTMQGERVALASSEEIPAGAKIRFTILLLQPALKNAVLEWLDYGRLRGLGQWRNGSHGRFTYVITGETGNDAVEDDASKKKAKSK